MTSPPTHYRPLNRRRARAPARMATALMLSVLSLPDLAVTQCIDYGDYLHWAGAIDLGVSDFRPGTLRSIDTAAEGDLFYVITYECTMHRCGYRLHVVDVSDRHSPRQIATRTGRTPITCVAAAGSYAYLIGGTRLMVLDVSNPSAPTLVATAVLPGGFVGDVAIEGNLLYAVGSFGLRVIDISDPLSPRLIGSTGGGGWFTAAAQAGFLYAVAGNTFSVIDATDPTSPHVTGALSASGYVAVDGAYAYVTGDRLQVVDVSNPSNPVLAADVDIPDLPADFVGTAEIHSGVAYVSTQQGIVLFDVSTPHSPQLTGYFFANSGPFPGPPLIADVLVEDDAIYLLNDNGAHYRLLVGHMASETAPVLGDVDMLRCRDVATAGSHAFVVSGGLDVVDLVDPSNPQVVGSLGGLGATEVVAEGEHAYCMDSREGALHIVDATAPESPVLAASVDLGPGDCGWPLGLAVAGGYVYASSGYGYAQDGLHVVDVRVSDSPAIVGTVSVEPDWISCAAVSGDFLYAGTGYGYSHVVDVSNRAHPEVTGSVHTSGMATGIAVAGSHAYTTTSEGFFVIDIADPSSPHVVGSLSRDTYPWKDVAVHGSHAYAWAWGQGFHVIDIADPSAPRIVGGTGEGKGDDSYWFVHGIAITDRCVVWNAYSFGLMVGSLQCDVFLIPQLLSDLTSSVMALDLPAGIERSLLAKVSAAGRAVDRGHRQSAVGPMNAFINEVEAQRGKHIGEPDVDTLIAYAETIVAMLVGDAAQPGGGRRLSASEIPERAVSGIHISPGCPNPFDRSTAMRLALPQASRIQVGVYDVAGRLVRTLTEDQWPQGTYTITWDGRNAGGLRVSGGTYFVRLTAGAVTQTRKVVFLCTR